MANIITLKNLSCIWIKKQQGYNTVNLCHHWGSDNLVTKFVKLIKLNLFYLNEFDYLQDKPGQLRLINFARERLPEAFEYMKKHALIKRQHAEERVSIYTTGIGGSQFGKQITAELNVKYVLSTY